VARGAVKVVSTYGALTVTFTAASGQTPAVYSDEACTAAISLPATVADGATTTFYFASPGAYALSVKTASGVQIANDLNTTRTVTVFTGEVGVYSYDTRLVSRDASGDSGRHSPGTDLSGTYKAPRESVWSHGAVGDGVADDSAAINAAIVALEAKGGGELWFGAGIFKAPGIVSHGAVISADTWGYGGIKFKGDGIRSTRLVGTTGTTLMQIGTTDPKVAYSFEDLWLIGPGKADAGSVAFDSRTTGGAYTFKNVLVEDFAIGVRLFDNTGIVAQNLVVRNCGTGYALGYYVDAVSLIGCHHDACDVGIWLGYFDAARSQTQGTVEQHAVNLIGCKGHSNTVGIFIEGNASDAINILGCYQEQWSDVAIRIGDAAFAHSISAHVVIDNGFFNGNRQSAPAGKKDHTIEVNYALSVHIRGGGFRNNTLAPINVRSSNANVTIDPGNYDTTSGESGSVKLSDATYQTVGNHRPLRIGQVSQTPVSYATGLPAAAASRFGERLQAGGVEYTCWSDGAGGYAWFVTTPRLSVTKPIYYTQGPPTSTMVWAAANEARGMFISVPRPHHPTQIQTLYQGLQNGLNLKQASLNANVSYSWAKLHLSKQPAGGRAFREKQLESRIGGPIPFDRLV
jgi:hypothetical protein